MITYLKNVIRDNFYPINNASVLGRGEFARRIQHRYSTFWEYSDGRKIQQELISTTDTLETIKNIELWQRKLSNKYNSREFAKILGSKVPELYWKGKDIRNINFSQLPKHYVIRPTIGHSCNLVFLMNESFNYLDRRTYSNYELIQIMTDALELNPHLEFLIEEFVKTEDGKYKIPKDYKFYTFNGEIARIEVINRTGPNDGSTSLYTPEWHQVENLSTKYSKAPYEEPPKCLDELIFFAKRISKAYEIFVRIDFYATDKGAVFGEFTPTPALGKVFTPQAEGIFVKYWDQYCKDMI